MESGRKESCTPGRERVHVGAGTGEALGVSLSLMAVLPRNFPCLESVGPARLPESQVMPAGARAHSRDADEPA